MDLAFLLSYARILINEVWAHKFLVFFIGAATALTILLFGTQWPVSFSSSMTIYADNENILRPLLARQAAVVRVEDQVRVVRDVMKSTRLLRLAAEKLHPELDESGVEQKAKVISRSLHVKGIGQSHIKISYSANSPDIVFDSLNMVTDLFIKDSSASQRSESREAFDFINKQVEQYKSQLVNAEENLKRFRSANLDGTEQAVVARIARLRADIETMKLNLDEVRSRINLLQTQLKDEGRFTAKTMKADIYRGRLANLQAQKANLLLTYQENYPDVVSITLQIEDMKQAILDAETTDVQGESEEKDQSFNSLYGQLRSKLSEARVEKNAIERKLKASIDLIEAEQARRKRIAEREAELSELTRDYNVTQRIYEDMLERKERARLSMSLSLAGQGVAYKIQEPATYPTMPVGLRFLHFAFIGLFVGALVPIGLLLAYVILDPRIRELKVLTEITDVPVLANIPHSTTSFARRFVHWDAVILLIFILLFCACYVGIGIAHKTGFIELMLTRLGGET